MEQISDEKESTSREWAIKVDEKETEASNLRSQLEQTNLSIQEIQSEKSVEIEKLELKLSNQCRENEEKLQINGKSLLITQI